MRTTLDLIGKLELEARNFDLVALAVVLEELTEFVFNSDQRKVERLAYLIGEGGQPVGFIGTETRGNTLRIRHRVLDECKDKLWAAEYLKSVTDLFLLVAQSSCEAYVQTPARLSCASSVSVQNSRGGGQR